MHISLNIIKLGQITRKDNYWIKGILREYLLSLEELKAKIKELNAKVDALGS